MSTSHIMAVELVGETLLLLLDEVLLAVPGVELLLVFPVSDLLPGEPSSSWQPVIHHHSSICLGSLMRKKARRKDPRTLTMSGTLGDLLSC